MTKTRSRTRKPHISRKPQPTARIRATRSPPDQDAALVAYGKARVAHQLAERAVAIARERSANGDRPAVCGTLDAAIAKRDRTLKALNRREQDWLKLKGDCT